MSISTTDNNAFFVDRSRPTPKPRTSWWAEAPPEGFTRRSWDELPEVSRGASAKHVPQGGMVVGHVGRAK